MCLDITKAAVAEYLSDMHVAVRAGRYQMAAREKNKERFYDYLFTEDEAKEVIL